MVIILVVLDSIWVVIVRLTSRIKYADTPLEALKALAFSQCLYICLMSHSNPTILF